MTQGPIEMLEIIDDRSSLIQTQDDASIPWIFNQILVPIIMVLAFVVLTQRMGYKKELDEVTKNLTPEKLLQLNFLLNHQIWELLKSWEELKSEKTQYYLLKFSKNEVDVSGNCFTLQLNDETFKTFCSRTYTAFAKVNPAIVEGMYRQVLQKSKIRDNHFSSEFIPSMVDNDLLNPRNWRVERSIDTTVDASNILEEKREIATRNRGILLNFIVSYCFYMQKTTIDIQKKVIENFHKKILENPRRFRLSGSISKIIEEIVKPSTSIESKKSLVREFKSVLNTEWQNKWTQDGYQMIVWNQ